MLVVSKSTYSLTSDKSVLAYKPVAKKVRAVAAPLKKEYHVIRRLPDDLLASLLPLPTHPPEFLPGIRSIQK